MKYTPKVHETPRLLLADAYTIGANEFQSNKAKEKSCYYITFRRILEKIDPELYRKGDNRMLFFGFQRILHRLLFKKIEQWEIDEADAFLEKAKVNAKGELSEYWYPRELWVRIVNEFNGRVPILIKAMPEGSVVYPNEPVATFESMVDGFGELAAWFESKTLQCWAPSERGTQDRHFYDQVRELYREYFPAMPQAELNFYASIVLTDFGDRAGMCSMESEDLGLTALYTFNGSDTFCGGYQAWKNSNHTPGVCVSVKALAHRNVQAYDKEDGAYNAIYEAAKPFDMVSLVNDCYSSRNAVEKYHIPLALRSKREGNGKIVVTRPDSGIAFDEVMWTINCAIQYGLFEDKEFYGKQWRFGTFLHFIEGDGLKHHDILVILRAILEMGCTPWSWGLFGMGGGQRNNLKRDNISAKYALDAMGNEYTPVVKFSDTYEKTTLPGPKKVLRSKEALEKCQTIVFRHEGLIDGSDDALVVYYDGLAPVDFFDGGMLDNFNTIKERSHKQFDSYPKSLSTLENHNYPASVAILNARKRLLEKYAPKKDVNAY